MESIEWKSCISLRSSKFNSLRVKEKSTKVGRATNGSALITSNNSNHNNNDNNNNNIQPLS